ncbi:MAG: amidohydrolase family protein [Pseudomonadota bacterium]
MIDAHHHIWRQADLPWLLGPERPRIFGPYAPIKRDYPIEEYLADIAGAGITGSVYVQANWAPNWAVDEARWVAAEAARTGWPMAIVAFADMTRRDCGGTLRKLSDIPGVVGIRHQFHWHQTPLYRFAPHAHLCDDPQVQRNVARLAEFGFGFDLQVFAPQMPGAVRLARACPDVTFILQHAGMLQDVSKAGRKAWLDGMKALAGCPNVVCKLSGLGTFVRRCDPDHIADQVRTALRLFGPERCLYGSNYPIEKLWTSYADLWAAFRKAVPKIHHISVFSETAARIYRLNRQPKE